MRVNLLHVTFGFTHTVGGKHNSSDSYTKNEKLSAAYSKQNVSWWTALWSTEAIVNEKKKFCL